MRQYAHGLVRRYRQPGVIVDANLLILLLIGQWRPERVATFRRTRNRFVAEDYDRVSELLDPLERIVTTPNILTEVSNLAGHLKSLERPSFFSLFAQSFARFDIRDVPAPASAAMPEFAKFGLTDAGIISLAREGYLVVTIDFPLANYLQTAGLAVLNYTTINVASIDPAHWR